MRDGSIFGLAGMLLLACSTQEARGAETLPLTEVAPHLSEGARRTMHDRYEQIEIMQAALVRGEVDAAQVLAQSLGPTSVPLSADLEMLRDSVPQAANAVRAGGGLEAVCAAFGALAATCGSCHQASGSSWQWETPVMPEGQSLSARMQRHLWGVDRMWEGLLSGSEGHFDRGAQVLAEAPLVMVPADSDAAPNAIEELAQTVHEVASAAPSAGGLGGRGQAFGQILATCSGCHRHYQELERLGVE